MKKSEIINEVQNSISSIFTKDDVIRIINKITDSDFDFDSLQNKIMDVINESEDAFTFDEIFNSDSAEYYIDGKEISISHIEMDLSPVIERIESRVNDILIDFFPRLTDES